MDNLYKIMFRSKASWDLYKQDILLLNQQMLNNNTRLDLTGVLLYHDRKFLQVIEGEEEKVKLIFDKIKTDHRHGDIEVITEGPIDERTFAGWNIEFHTVSEDELENIPGLSRYLYGDGTDDGRINDLLEDILRQIGDREDGD